MLMIEKKETILEHQRRRQRTSPLAGVFTPVGPWTQSQESATVCRQHAVIAE